MEHLSDEELIERFRASSPAEARVWVDELFRRYYTRIAAWCFRFSGDRDTALDLAQEIFFKAYRYLPSFRGDAKFSTWLYTISRNHCLNHSKSKASEPLDASDPVTLELPDGAGAGPEASLQRKQKLQVMRKLIAETLDDVEAKVMTLHYAEEMPLEAITRLLGLANASGAKAYIVSARRKLNGAVRRWKAAQGAGHERRGE